MRSLLLLVVACLIPSVAAAEGATIALANFDADEVKAPPDLTLPGGPDGDYLILSLQPVGTYTVVKTAGPLTNKPLRLDRDDGPGSFNMQIWWDEAAHSCDHWVVEWCSAVITPIPPYFIVLRGVQGAIFGAVNYRGPSSITLDVPSGEKTVGTYGTEAQCFEWHYDRSTAKQSLYIDGELVADGIDAIVGQSVDPEWVGFEPSFQNAFSFAVDDIRVGVVDCPAVPTESTSWGGVKARFR